MLLNDIFELFEFITYLWNPAFHQRNELRHRH